MGNRISKDRQNELALAYRATEQAQFFNELLESLQGMINKEAGRVRAATGNKLSIEDLQSEGRIGILKAIRTFDPKKGDFSAVAYPHIRNEMHKHGLQFSSSLTIPKSNRARRIVTSISEYDGDTAAAAEALGISELHAQAAMNVSRGGGIEEFNGAADDTLARISDIDIRSIYERAVDHFTDDELRLVEAHFIHEIPRNQLAREYGVTARVITGRLAEALQKVRAALGVSSQDVF